jgi:hypothetical protein
MSFCPVSCNIIQDFEHFAFFKPAYSNGNSIFSLFFKDKYLFERSVTCARPMQRICLQRCSTDTEDLPLTLDVEQRQRIRIPKEMQATQNGPSAGGSQTPRIQETKKPESPKKSTVMRVVHDCFLSQFRTYYLLVCTLNRISIILLF